MLFLFILLLYVLELFSRVRQDDDCGCDLFTELVQLFVSFFDFLVQGLILNLQLFKVD